MVGRLLAIMGGIMLALWLFYWVDIRTTEPPCHPDIDEEMCRALEGAFGHFPGDRDGCAYAENGSGLYEYRTPVEIPAGSTFEIHVAPGKIVHSTRGTQ